MQLDVVRNNSNPALGLSSGAEGVGGHWGRFGFNSPDVLLYV